MSSFVTAAECSVSGKITRPGFDTRRSRPPASTVSSSGGAISPGVLRQARGAFRAGRLDPVRNAQIADRLEAFAALLELAEANPYTSRAYRRAAETIRATPLAVAELVRTGRVRELRGIGPGIEARLPELAETGEMRELAEPEPEETPGAE